MQPKGGRLPLFCVPGAGGNAIYLHNLAQHLGAEQPFYGLQGRGMDGEAEPHTTVESMAEYYLQAIRTVQSAGPYRLAGHSLGGWVAFEMAYRLEQEGQEVAFLGILDTPTPTREFADERAEWTDARWIAELAARIAQLLNPTLQVLEEDLLPLDPAAQMEFFRRALVTAEVFPQQAGVESLQHTLALFKAHAGVRYSVEGKYLGLRMHLYRTAHAPGNRPELEGSRSWGWEQTGEVEVLEVPGDHLTLLRPPHVRQLAEAMEQSLSQVGASGEHILGLLLTFPDRAKVNKRL
jgi:thioesterase domain-containing protein